MGRSEINGDKNEMSSFYEREYAGVGTEIEREEYTESPVDSFSEDWDSTETASEAEKKKEHMFSNLAAMVPFYDESGGNCTRLLYTNGNILEDKRSIKWMIGRAARHHGTELYAMRESYGKYLGCYYGVPLPFTSTLVLVPVQSRLIYGTNDGACGYVNARAIINIEKITPEEAEKAPETMAEGQVGREEKGEDIADDWKGITRNKYIKFRTQIHLRGGHVIYSLQVPKTVKRKFRQAQLAYERYRTIHQDNFGVEMIMEEEEQGYSPRIQLAREIIKLLIKEEADNRQDLL